MAGSILTDTKASLGLAEDHTAFDAELILFINTALADAAQLGVGPVEGVEITSKSMKWSEITDDNPLLNALKGYVHLRVKLLFDPPDIGFVLTAMKEQVDKAEWRLMVAVDPAAEETTDTTNLDEVGFRREWITYYGV